MVFVQGRQIATRGTSSLKSDTTIRPTVTAQPKQVPAGGELKHVGVTEVPTSWGRL